MDLPDNAPRCPQPHRANSSSGHLTGDKNRASLSAIDTPQPVARAGRCSAAGMPATMVCGKAASVICSPCTGFSELSMSRWMLFGGRRSCMASIQRPADRQGLRGSQAVSASPSRTGPWRSPRPHRASLPGRRRAGASPGRGKDGPRRRDPRSRRGARRSTGAVAQRRRCRPFRPARGSVSNSAVMSGQGRRRGRGAGASHHRN